MVRINGTDIVTPSQQEVPIARESAKALLHHFNESSLQFVVSDGKRLPLPPSAGRILLSALHELGQGHGVSMQAFKSEITVQEGADILNIPKSYFSKLLDDSVIASRKEGEIRFVRLDDVLTYQKQRYAEQLKGMEELSALDQELGLYDVIK
jgi:hypothetical protein